MNTEISQGGVGGINILGLLEQKSLEKFFYLFMKQM